MRLEEGRITTPDGVSLYWRRMGEGAPTVLVPNAVWLEAVLEPLARNHTLVLYDLRSRGRSDRVVEPGSLGIDPDVADLETVRAALGLGAVVTFGHSYLATVAARHAAAHPQGVSRLVLVGAMPPRRLPYYAQGFPPASAILHPPHPGLQAMRKAGLDRTDPAAFGRTFFREFMLPRQVGDPAAVDRIPLDALEHPNEHPDHFVPIFTDHVMPSLGDWDERERLASIRVPTLLVQGSREPQPLEGAREWVASIPEARLLVIEGSGHFPFVEAPEQFFPAMEAFLSGAWPPAAA